MFNTRNILIATGAIIALALIIWFVSRAKRKNENVAVIPEKPDSDVQATPAPVGKMDSEPEAEGAKVIDLNRINLSIPLIEPEPNDNFPLKLGSKGERVRRFQNYLYKEHAKYKEDRLDFGDEQGVWGAYTDYFAQKYGIKSVPEETYNMLRIATYNHKTN